MKYWNKQPEVRERCWIRIRSRATIISFDFRYPYYYDAKHRLQLHPSTGKFYRSGGDFWFEYAADAKWFRIQDEADAIIFRLQDKNRTLR